MTVPSLFVPSRSGSQVKPGAFITCQGCSSFGFQISGRINRLRAKICCHAVSVRTCSDNACFASAPTCRCDKKCSRDVRYASTRSHNASNLSASKGRLTAPQSMSFSVEASFTIKRSAGERPVRLPVSTTRAPLSASLPSLRISAISTSSADVKSVSGSWTAVGSSALATVICNP